MAGNSKAGVNGLYEMGANVWEWIQGEGPQARTRGGSWWYGAQPMHREHSAYKPKDFYAIYIGFRCASDLWISKTLHFLNFDPKFSPQKHRSHLFYLPSKQNWVNLMHFFVVPEVSPKSNCLNLNEENPMRKYIQGAFRQFCFLMIAPLLIAFAGPAAFAQLTKVCLLYTSDAADE